MDYDKRGTFLSRWLNFMNCKKSEFIWSIAKLKEGKIIFRSIFVGSLGAFYEWSHEIR